MEATIAFTCCIGIPEKLGYYYIIFWALLGYWKSTWKLLQYLGSRLGFRISAFRLRIWGSEFRGLRFRF